MVETFYHCLKTKFRAIFQRRSVERELADELQHHIEAKIHRLIEQGMTPDEARTTTLREFGGIEQRKEECRDARGLSLLEDLWRDVKFGGCALIKNRTFAIVGTLTIALGISANTRDLYVGSRSFVADAPWLRLRTRRRITRHQNLAFRSCAK